MLLHYAVGHHDFKLLASSHGCTLRGATDAVMSSEFNMDLELLETRNKHNYWYEVHDED